MTAFLLGLVLACPASFYLGLRYGARAEVRAVRLRQVDEALRDLRGLAAPVEIPRGVARWSGQDEGRAHTTWAGMFGDTHYDGRA